MRTAIQCKPGSDVTKGKVRMHVMEALGTSGGTAPPVLKIGRRGRCVCIKRLGGTRVGVEDF
jgi:hypothetical protein